MSTTLLLDLERNRAEADARTFEGWRESVMADADALAQIARRAVQVANETPDSARAAWKLLWDRASAGQIDDYQRARETLQLLFAHYARSVTVAQELAAAAAGRGMHIEGVEHLSETLALQSKMRERAFACWPDFDEAGAREASVQCERGEGRTPEEVLRELCGAHPPGNP